MKSKFFTISVVICAHNEGKTIRLLLKSILEQEASHYNLAEIIIYSDASSDNTEDEVRRILDPRIRLILGKTRQGKLASLNSIFSITKGDIIVSLDADIELASRQTIDELILPFYQDKDIVLVGGNRKPKKAKTFIEESIHTSIRAYDNIALHINHANNIYNCHGQILALSRQFIKKIYLPLDIASEDTFLYFSCVKLGFKFYYARKARVTTKTADNLHDAILQYKRYLPLAPSSKKYFSELVTKEFRLPLRLRLRYLVREFTRKPIETFSFFLLKLYCKYIPLQNQEKKQVWNIALSTKGGLTK